MATAVRELQTLFVMGGEAWPSEEEVLAANGKGGDGSDDDCGGGDENDDDDECEMWLVDETASKNAAFWFGPGFGLGVGLGLGPVVGGNNDDAADVAGDEHRRDHAHEGERGPRGVWRRIDLPPARTPLALFDRRFAHVPDPADDEEEVYGKATGTA